MACALLFGRAEDGRAPHEGDWGWRCREGFRRPRISCARWQCRFFELRVVLVLWSTIHFSAHPVFNFIYRFRGVKNGRIIFGSLTLQMHFV